ncbi:MAG: hypothetical protein KGO02_17195 [Alphaproteobacteria bacterium]|nr:hypothetical protein [Alphaproteobacteria bacterium]
MSYTVSYMGKKLNQPENKMARVRSPNYPAFGLNEALSRIRTIHEAEQHLSAPKEVIAKHLGYNGLNGGSLKAISALLKYGLLDEAQGNKLKVSPLAISILYPGKGDDRASAIREAAFKPGIFQEIFNEWEGERPSDENLRAYLIRRQFATDAVDRVIEAYRETMDLVAQEGSDYSASATPTGGQRHQERSAMQPATHGKPSVRQPHETVFTPASGEPFRVSFTGAGIEVSGLLSSPERADELVRAINALKVLLRPAGSATRPDAEEETP